jgi:hypothetical protein
MISYAWNHFREKDHDFPGWVDEIANHSLWRNNQSLCFATPCATISFSLSHSLSPLSTPTAAPAMALTSTPTVPPSAALISTFSRALSFPFGRAMELRAVVPFFHFIQRIQYPSKSFPPAQMPLILTLPPIRPGLRYKKAQGLRSDQLDAPYPSNRARFLDGIRTK